MKSNLVEVEHYTSSQKTTRSNAFQDEVKHYLECYPLTNYVDILLTDLNGCFRGKRIPVSSLTKLDAGCYFPASVFTMDILGNVVEQAGLGQQKGEPDHLCVPILGSLTPSAADPIHIAQVFLTMLDEEGQPFEVEPRNVLQRVWEQLRQRGLIPVIAIELEFYLIDQQRDAEGELQPPCVPNTQQRNLQSQVYSLDNLNNFSPVLHDINLLAKQQGLPADGVLAEASPGQFEVNLNHTDNILLACDHALMLKRLVRQVAENYGMHATFMAKPYVEHAGSGMHVHISMLNKQGENVFAQQKNDSLTDSIMLKQMLAGMIAMMPHSIALLAPNVNSFRRFQPGMYVPMKALWGHNNRTVALRIPCSDQHNYRVEYRVAGADANPYLVVAAIFAGMLYGLDEPNLPLPEPITGNGLEEEEGSLFPIRQSDALKALKRSSALTSYLGETFTEVYHTCKSDELRQFERLITSTELEWMLKNI